MIWGGRDNPEQVKPFVEHLQDLRSTILWSLGFLVAGMTVAIPLAPSILRLTKAPIAAAGRDPDTFLRVLRVTGGLSIALRVILWSGILFSLPLIVLVVGRFVLPGLKPKEKRALAQASGFAVLLFVAGVCMGYFTTLPVAVRMMLRINTWLGLETEFVELADYVSFVLRLLLSFGLAFELPVVLIALGNLGIVHSRQLRDKRPHVIVGLLVVAMILTPPDPLTQLLMAGPLVLLYEMCIWLIWFRERARNRESTTAGDRHG